MKKIRNLYVYLICIIQIVFMFLLYLANDKLDVYTNYVYISLSILFMFIQISFVLKEYKLGIVLSVLFIINALFIRNKIEIDDYFNFNIYLDYWFKHISNDVVFYNLIGNVFVFIPLGLFIYFDCKKILKTLITILLLICLFEFSQALLKLGIFDVVDIILNYLGVMFVILGVYIWEIKIKKKNN